MLMALEIGIGWGAVQSGLTYGGEVANITFMYSLCSAFGVLSTLGLVYALFRMNKGRGKKVGVAGGV
jgi:hypothetical protein